MLTLQQVVEEPQQTIVDRIELFEIKRKVFDVCETDKSIVFDGYKQVLVSSYIYILGDDLVCELICRFWPIRVEL